MIRVVWAIDPFDDEEQLLAQIGAILSSLGGPENANIEPVFVLENGYATGTLAFEDPSLCSAAARRAIEHRLESFNIPALGPPRVLPFPKSESGPAPSSGAAALANFAKDSAADLIIVGSHRGRSVAKLLFGSFSETLTSVAEVPVLIVGPSVIGRPEIRARRSRQVHFAIHDILFPTDFGDGAFAAFRKVLELARILRTRVTILHWTHGPEKFFQQRLSGKHQVRNLSLHWKALARQVGVPLNVIIDKATPDATQAVLREARLRKGGLIAMTNGTRASWMISRKSPLPMWMIQA